MANIVERIKKLLELSKHNNSSAEAAAAAGLAQELMFKHQIGEADLTVTEEARTPEEIVEEAVHTEKGRQRNVWKSALAHAVAQGFGCEMYYSRYPEIQFKVFGLKSAVQTVNYVFGYLNLEITRLCAEAGKGQGRTWQNSFRLGAVAELRERLQQQRREQGAYVAAKTVAEPTSTALALYKTEEERVESAWKETSKRIGLRAGRRTRTRSDYSAYSRGREAGASISLNAGRGGLPASKQRMAG